MLSDQVLQLLTAFVDGELSSRQREEVLRLMNKSGEARELVRQLQENANKLKQLPRKKVEPSLVDEVLRAIAEAKATPAPAPTKSRIGRRRWAPYFAASLAASALIAVISLVIYQSVTTPGVDPADPNSSLAKITSPPEKKSEAKVIGEKKIEPKSTPDSPTKKPLPNPLLANLVDGTFREFGAVPVVERPFLAQFRDLQKDSVASANLSHELDRSRAVQLDVTVKSNVIAMERLREVLLERGVALVADPSATKKLRDKSQTKVEYLVFAENLTSSEVTKLMGDLGQTFVVGQGNKERKEPSPYQKVAVTKLAGDERAKVAKLLGVEVAVLEPKDAKEVKPAPKADRQAVLLPTTPGGTPSDELRRFANERPTPQRGTLQVLIRIRQE